MSLSPALAPLDFETRRTVQINIILARILDNQICCLQLERYLKKKKRLANFLNFLKMVYESFADVGEIRVYQRADFQSGSRVLKKVF